MRHQPTIAIDCTHATMQGEGKTLPEIAHLGHVKLERRHARVLARKCFRLRQNDASNRQDVVWLSQQKLCTVFTPRAATPKSA